MGLDRITSSQDTLDLLRQAAEQRAAAQQAQETELRRQTVATAADSASVEEQAVQTNADTLAAAAAGVLDEGDGGDTNQTLINKANSGAELTGAELSELKELDAALYAQVVKAQEARAALKAEMQRSPNEAGKAAQAAISRVSDDEDDGTRSMVRRALRDVCAEFTAKYDQAAF